MHINEQTILVTGANGGIGQALINAFLAAGAKKIYACARDVASLEHLRNNEKIQLVKLDITNTAHIEKAGATCGDTTVLVNNAGMGGSGLLGSPAAARAEMEVNYFGTLAMCSAFAPVLGKNGGGCMVYMISVIGLVNMPSIGTYCASKAALHSLTQGLRGVLAAQKTTVIGVYPGPVDTRMTDGLEMPKASAESVAQEILQGLKNRAEDIYPDAYSKSIQKALAVDAKQVERELAAY